MTLQGSTYGIKCTCFFIWYVVVGFYMWYVLHDSTCGMFLHELSEAVLRGFIGALR